MEQQEILNAINGLRNTLISVNSHTSPVDGWLPRSEVMRFMNYGNTQMCALEKSGELITSKIGKRVFIRKDSLTKLLEKNIQSRG
jgi:hypothetical protein